MVRNIVFDLSEVLIAGLLGIEHALARRYGTTPRAVLDALGGEHLMELLHGRFSEDQYLKAVVAQHGWDIEARELKAIIRRNLDRKVEGMEDVVERLSRRYQLVLLSDHGSEWVAHVRESHPILKKFSHQFFSCEMGCTKRDPAAFEAVVTTVGGEPSQYLFVDDNPGNVSVAKQVGMQAIRFTGVKELEQDLNELKILP